MGLINVICVLVGLIGGYFLPRFFKWIRRFAPIRNKIKKSIEKGINNEFREALIETCAIPVLSGGIKIEWQESFDKERYLNEEGDIVVKLSYSNDKNLSRCFTKALMLYLDEAFIPQAKPFVGLENHDGCKFTIAKEFTLKRDPISYRHFITDYLAPLIINNSSMEDLLNKLETISKCKLFKTVLLREMFLLCESGSLPSAAMRKEVSDFINFLWNIANKKEYEEKEGKEPPLRFNGHYIKVQITLVKKMGAEGIFPHVRACEIAFKEGAKTVYITGWGGENVADTREVAKLLSGKGFKNVGELTSDIELPDRFIPATCFIFEKEKRY